MVLDPFLGIESTLIAAARWGRNSIGIDIDPKFINEAYERMRQGDLVNFKNIEVKKLFN